MAKKKAHIRCFKCGETDLKKFYRYPSGRYFSYCRCCDNLRRKLQAQLRKYQPALSDEVLQKIRNNVRKIKIFLLFLLMLLIILFFYVLN